MNPPPPPPVKAPQSPLAAGSAVVDDQFDGALSSAWGRGECEERRHLHMCICT